MKLVSSPRLLAYRLNFLDLEKKVLPVFQSLYKGGMGKQSTLENQSLSYTSLIYRVNFSQNCLR
jgi:hypothetical protein